MQAVENYHGMLLENSHHTNVVTDLGMEALPAIELQLAWLYFPDGDNDKSESMIASVEANYPESIFIVRKPPSGRQFVPVNEVISRLRQHMDGTRQINILKRQHTFCADPTIAF